ncbi:MAG: hypothetical protein ACRD3D_05275 [Terriglobia bacterium]
MPQRLRALIAMSDSGGQSALATTVAARGLEPILAPSLREAREVLSHSRISVVFCENKLEDGEFREMLRENTKLVPNVPVVVCSSSYDHNLYMDAMTEGAFDFVAYPYAPREIEWILSCALPRAASAGAA